MTIKVRNIKYDTEGAKGLLRSLPKEGAVVVDSEWYKNDPDDAVASAISDGTGVLVKSFEIVN